MTTPVVRPVVQQHCDDASFLWLLRAAAVEAPHQTLDQLSRLDDRLEAHLDGLRLAGDGGWRMAYDALSHQEAGETFVAGVLALGEANPARIEAVLEVAASSPDLVRPMASALAWSEFRQVGPTITDLIESASAPLRRIGVSGFVLHRRDPGPALERLLDDDDAPLRARCLRAVGELGLARLGHIVRHQMDDDHEGCRFAAAWASALLGDRSAIRVLGAITAEGGPYAEQACTIGLRSLSTRDGYKAHQELASNPHLARLSVSAAGMIGDPALVDWLLAQLDKPALARLAGEALTTITGADLEHPGLAGQAPDGFSAGPSEDPADENVAPDPDEHLPWPDPDKMRDWWYDYRSEFRSGTRYLLGNPVEPPWLEEVLVRGKQRQRAAAALELVLANPGHPLFDVRAKGSVQQERLRR